MSAISGDTWVYLRDTLDKYPSLFLDEMQDLLRARSGVRYPISTICYTLQRKHYTMRVLKQRALRRDREEEQRFIDVMSEYPGDFFIWVDETRKDPRSLVRRRGRGVRGFRTSVLERFSRTRGYSATGVFSLEGMIDFAISDVAGVHADLFLAMLSNCVIPHCLPFPGRHSIVVLDNASIHHDPRVRQMIEATGARLIFLPPYANDKNPIEEAFSKVKALLQRHRRFATDYPKLALGRALESITHVDAAGYIGHAGYSVEELIPGVLFSGGE